MTTENPSRPDMLELVFEHRNRAYGAYILRRDYPNSIRKALSYAAFFFGLLIGVPLLLQSFAKNEVSKAKITIVCPIGKPPDIVRDAPPEPKKLKVEPTSPFEQPKRPNIRFLPPVIHPNEAESNEQVPDNQAIEDFKGDVSKTNSEGDGEAPPPSLDDFKKREGQVESAKPQEPDNGIHTFVEIPPSFPGGDAEMMSYILKHYKVPTLARETNVPGKVLLTFVVEKNGEISDVKCLRDPGAGLGKEAIRVVSTMPRWVPGEQNGHAVRVRFTLPIQIHLE